MIHFEILCIYFLYHNCNKEGLHTNDGNKIVINEERRGNAAGAKRVLAKAGELRLNLVLCITAGVSVLGIVLHRHLRRKV